MNQNAAQDAGKWSVNTFTVIQNEAWPVDGGIAENSFTAVAGNIEASRAIDVDNPMTYAYNANYTLWFRPSGTIEVGGTIILWVPVMVPFLDNVDSRGSCISGF